MKNLYFSSFLFFAFMLFSCQSDKSESKHEYVKELVSDKRIFFPIDENTSYLSKSIFQFERNGEEFLHFENSQNSTYDIVIFDIDSQKVERRIPLQSEGPNGVISMFGSKPFPNSDNFLAFQHLVFRISILNKNGEVLRNYQLKSPGRFVRVLMGSFAQWPTFIKDSVLYFNQSCKSKKRNEVYAPLPMFASLDFRTGEIDFPSLYFPTTFDGDYTHISGDDEFSYDYNEKEGRLVCSFMKYDSIMVTDDLKNVRWYDAKSKYLGSMKPNVNNHTNTQGALIKYSEESKYSHIMYDKYRDVYYRFAEMPCELAEDETPYDVGAPKAREFSVIILDKDFKIVGETKFPGNKYFYNMSFIGKDGLYISENNTANPQFDENKLVFACFNLVNVKR